MQIQSKLWFLGACNFKKMPKMGLSNVADVYSKSSKNQTNGDNDLKYGLNDY